ncbi:hypothetical protein HMI54_010893 [Coelomomyces lativittatus]|nr:hypothetical protein HMI54_010893 [Coelomomyces lativittatus]KAJ1501723.1 hypothetical protein HMI56_003080 [Coelomomyces lativittatus]
MVIIVDIFKFFHNVLNKLFISFQDYLTPNFYILKIEFFKNNYFYYEEHDQAKLLDDYEVTIANPQDSIALPPPRLLCIEASPPQSSSQTQPNPTPGTKKSWSKKKPCTSSVPPSDSPPSITQQTSGAQHSQSKFTSQPISSQVPLKKKSGSQVKTSCGTPPKQNPMPIDQSPPPESSKKKRTFDLIKKQGN